MLVHGGLRAAHVDAGLAALNAQAAAWLRGRPPGGGGGGVAGWLAAAAGAAAEPPAFLLGEESPVWMRNYRWAVLM